MEKLQLSENKPLTEKVSQTLTLIQLTQPLDICLN